MATYKLHLYYFIMLWRQPECVEIKINLPIKNPRRKLFE